MKRVRPLFRLALLGYSTYVRAKFVEEARRLAVAWQAWYLSAVFVEIRWFCFLASQVAVPRLDNSGQHYLGT